MLVLTAPTQAKKRALRLDSIGRRLQHLHLQCSIVHNGIASTMGRQKERP